MVSVRSQLLSHPILFAAPRVPGLSAGEQELLDKLVELWRVKQPRNALRQRYADGKIRPDNLGVSVPDDLVDLIGVVVGWPAKAVTALADRISWDGVDQGPSDADRYGLTDLLDANSFDVEIGQIIVSALTQSVAFVTACPGDTASGEPDVVIAGRSAQWGAALWDRTRRRLSAGLTVDDVDDLGAPASMTLYTPDEIIHLATSGSGWFPQAVIGHQLGRVPMEALPFEPSLDRPMGRSRISRDVMSITQRAMRTILRDDLAAELFTAPGMLLRGVDPDVFAQLKEWSWRLGAVKGLSRDEEGELPEVDWIPQQSTQPLVDQLRELACEFAGATSLPLSSLGIVQDNPSSAEAIAASREDLCIKAERAMRTWSGPLSRVYQDAVMLRDGLTEPPDGLRRARTRWGDPSRPSVVSRSDAVTKQIAAISWLADSPVVLEKLGYTQAEIDRLMADKKRAEAGTTLDRLTALTRPQQPPDGGNAPAAQEPGQAVGGPTTSRPASTRSASPSEPESTPQTRPNASASGA